MGTTVELRTSTSLQGTLRRVKHKRRVEGSNQIWSIGSPTNSRQERQGGFREKILKRSEPMEPEERNPFIDILSPMLTSFEKHWVNCVLREALPAHWPHRHTSVLDCSFTHTLGGQERKILEAKLECCNHKRKEHTHIHKSPQKTYVSDCFAYHRQKMGGILKEWVTFLVF